MNTYSIPFKQLDLRQLDNIAATPLERHLVERLLALTDPRLLEHEDTTEEVDNLVADGDIAEALSTHGNNRFEDGQRDGADEQYHNTVEHIEQALDYLVDNIADRVAEVVEGVPAELLDEITNAARFHADDIRDALKRAKP